ncbi:MAG: DUF6498-containing protein [Planctomycetota bacterium]|jgi:hypothetical protein
MTESDTNNLQEERAKSRGGSTWQLVLANLAVIVWAVYAKWDASIIVWVYWTQSVIIGIFWFVRIVTHRHLYEQRKLGVDGRPRRLTGPQRLSRGVFFLFHYGGFHLGYLALVAAGFLSRDQKPSFPGLEIAVTACFFFAEELLSFIKDPHRIQRRTADMSLLMGYPYRRIVPMHVTMLAGGWLYGRGLGGHWILPIFLLLKMMADIGAKRTLYAGFAPRRLKAVLGMRPLLEKSPYGDKLVLSAGRKIDLFEHPELARNVEGIFKLPPEVREEVVQGLLEKESRSEQAEPVKCRCEHKHIIRGDEADVYAERHLRRLYELDDGFTLFVCPQTGKRWVRAGDILRAKES